jgi:hypothetical protein
MRRALLSVAPVEDPWVGEFPIHGMIFVHVPKTAGSSLVAGLFTGDPHYHRPIRNYYITHRARAAAAWKFCFVRNPWDRMLSAFSYLKQGQGTTDQDDCFAREVLYDVADFEDFLRRLEARDFRRRVMRFVHFETQSYWITLPGVNRPEMNFVGRFERIIEDVQVVRTRLGLPPGSLDRQRPSNRLPYREAYTDRGRDLVANLYDTDLRMLDYEW